MSPVAKVRASIATVRASGKCPECGGQLEFGFGLAGGGYGPYVFCSGSDGDGAGACEFFLKEQEELER